MLNAYLAQTAALLQNPPAATPLYTQAALTSAINIARFQIAGEGQCIRLLGTVSLSAAQGNAAYSTILALPPTGVGDAINVRMIQISVGGVGVFLDSQPWEWFFRYYLTNGQTGQPTVWAKNGDGVNGQLFVSPVPTATTALQLDCAFLPIALVDDTTAESIPYPWTDCVQYLAAYYALLAAQAQARSADSDRMFARYTEFSVRARNMSTASVLPNQYARSGRVPPTASQQQGAA